MINDIHGRENIITKLLNNANYKDKDLIISMGIWFRNLRTNKQSLMDS